MIDLDGRGIPEDVIGTFRRWERFLEDEVEFGLKGSGIHGKPHCARVLLYSLLLCRELSVADDVRDAVCMAAVFHDSRRQDDWYDVGHGDRAAEYYRQFCSGGRMDFDERSYIAMRYHDRDDSEGESAMGSAGLGGSGLAVYRILKDADGLDRFRLAPDGLDPRFLRLNHSRGLVPLAMALNGVEPER